MDVKGPVLGLTFVLAGLVVFLVSKRAADVVQLEHEEKSKYSHIRIRNNGSVRTMYFVRDSGREVAQSSLNLDAPHELRFSYTQTMFASYLFKPQQDRVLIIGLGGGAMVHFLKHHQRDLFVDVVEIDPVIVKLADEYFSVRSERNVNIMTVDAFDYLRDTEKRYDVIYFDAFLKPAKDTDATGVPQRLKTIAFYKAIQNKLTLEGLVVFNLNSHAQTDDDIATIAEAFPQTAVFSCPRSTNVVVVGSASGALDDEAQLKFRAAQLDSRFGANFSFQRILENRVR